MKVVDTNVLPSAADATGHHHVAALAAEYGAELCSTDRDFSRFPGIRWTDPLR